MEGRKALKRLWITCWFTAMALSVGVAPPASGDKWASPERMEALSQKGNVRLTVLPARDFGIGETAPLGLLERKDAEGAWVLAWGRPLLNRWAPLEAVVADDGRFVVTFDEHGMAGSGENDLVVYDADGRMAKELSLAELFSEDEIDGFPRSVSSVWWRCGKPRIEAPEARLVLLVPRPRADGAECVEVALELPSGRRLPGAKPVDSTHEAATGTRRWPLYSATRFGNRGPDAVEKREARIRELVAASPPLVRAVRTTLDRERVSFAEIEPEVLGEVQRLVAAGAAVDAVDPNGDSALSWALRCYFGKVARFLVERGADLSPPSARGQSLLGEAIPLGDAELVGAMLARGASADELPRDHHTPLTLAATFQERAVLEVLLGAGADPNRRGQFESPLEAALRGEWWDGAQRLAAAGADASGLPPDLRLRWAVEQGDGAVALAVLAAQVRFDPDQEVLESALCRAAERGDAEMIRVLVAQGAGPNAPAGLFRTTPLLEAAKMGHLLAVDSLLASGARANDPDAYGFHPLDAALLFRRHEVRKRLLAAGAVEGIPGTALAEKSVLRSQPPR